MVTINVKSSNEAKFSVEVGEAATIAEVKDAIAKAMEATNPTPVANQRLIFSGRVLKDEENLATYKIVDGSTIHLVRSGLKPATPAASSSDATAAAPATSATTASPAAASPGIAQLPNSVGSNPPVNPYTNLFNAGGAMGAGAGAGAGGFAGMGGMGMPDMGGLGAGADPAMMSQMMQNPAFAAMASQLFSNPQFLDAMVASNPEMAGMMTPQVRQMMQSPQFRAMMSDPNMVRQMMQMAPMMGGGMNPFAAGMGGGAPGGTDGGAGAGAPGMNPTGAGAFDPALLSMLMGGGMRGGAAALPPPPANPEEAYQEQLRQLQDMGFYDASENIRALTATRGNASAAVEWLLNNPPGGPR